MPASKRYQNFNKQGRPRSIPPSRHPPQLTEEFKKAVGTTPGELEALCDTLTDSKKIASAEVKSEELTGETGRVKVALTHRDGRIEEKDERVKKVDGKWLMDS